MFSNSYQSGFLSIFYSVGSNPLALWDKQVKNGHIRRVVDDDVKSLVLEIAGTNVATTYITCPIQARASLGVQLPFLVMVIKNMKRYFTFEIQILDDKDMRRRFRVSNFQSSTKVLPFCTTMPIGLSDGWNQVQFNLADFTKRAYGSTYMETTRVQIHANVRIRRIYFSDRLYSDDDMPNEFKLFSNVGKPKDKEVQEKKRESVVKHKGSIAVEEPQIRKSAEKMLEELPPPTTPVVEDAASKAAPSEAPPAPSPVDTGALNTSEVEMKTEETEGGEATAESKEATEGEAPPAEGAEVAAPEEGGEGGAPAEEAAEAPPEAPTDEATEQVPVEATEEPAATAEPATTEEPTTTEEPATAEVITEEPATEPATEVESESPKE